MLLPDARNARFNWGRYAPHFSIVNGQPAPPFEWDWQEFSMMAGEEQGQWVGYSDGGPTRPQPAFGSISRQPTPKTNLIALYEDTNSGVFLAVFDGDFVDHLAGVRISFGGYEMDAFEIELISGNTWVRFSGIEGDLSSGSLYQVSFITPA